MQPRALALYSFANAGDYSSPPPKKTHVYLYVANAGSDNLSAYEVNRDGGNPTPLSPASYATGVGPSVLVIHPTAPFLYTANSGSSNDISAFLLPRPAGPLTGALKPISGSPFLSGVSVSSLAFGAGGKFLCAGKQINAKADNASGAATGAGGV